MGVARRLDRLFTLGRYRLVHGDGAASVLAQATSAARAMMMNIPIILVVTLSAISFVILTMLVVTAAKEESE
jgi:heme A synthase